jgi:hypothetical protein
MTGRWPWPAALEGTVAAPRSHRVLLKTPAVRVLEIVFEPGEREPEHVHRCPSAMIVDEPARIRYYESGALTFESPPTVDRAPVRAIWMDPEGRTPWRTSNARIPRVPCRAPDLIGNSPGQVARRD